MDRERWQYKCICAQEEQYISWGFVRKIAVADDLQLTDICEIFSDQNTTWSFLCSILYISATELTFYYRE